jgi:hypothetical protein
MTRILLRSLLTLSTLHALACTDDIVVSPELDGSVNAADAGSVITIPPEYPDGCAPLGDPLPSTLSCTGLYGKSGTESVEKSVPARVRGFAPATALWSDGAEKQRWIDLPDGTQVDTSDPSKGWKFPDGTRVWKEFKMNGKRIETRFMWKADGTWRFATYRWNAEETAATIFGGGDVPLAGGGTYYVPKNADGQNECNECHVGARDKLLGFEPVLLGLPGAQGLTLPTLVAENRLSHPPARTNYVIPDDGTGMAAPALAWIHVNCGVSCHNDTGNAIAKMSKMYLRIDSTKLDEPTPNDWNTVKMTKNVPSMTPNFLGYVRVLPGLPDQSLIVKLASTRGTNEAMPPIATRTVDPKGLAAIREWITRLGSLHGTPDAGVMLDASTEVDTAVPVPVVPELDAGVGDAEAPDAEADGEVDAADVDAADAEPAPIPPVVTPPVTVPPVVEPPVTPPPVVEPPVVAPPVTPPPVVEPPVTPPVVPPVVVEPPVTPPVVPPVVVEPPVTPPVVEPPPAEILDAGLPDAELPDAALPVVEVPVTPAVVEPTPAIVPPV